MAIKIYKSKKNNLKKSGFRTRSKYSSSSRALARIRARARSSSKSKSHTKSNKKKVTKNLKKSKQSGGFFSDSKCNIASVREAGFSVTGSGSGPNAIPGLSLPGSRALIYNPNCKTDSYQAMIS